MRIVIISLLFIVGIVTNSFGQCNGYGPKECKVYWGNFHSNGQSLAAEMETGETIELQMIFHRKHDYKLFICAEDFLGDIEFKILTATGDVLFNNKEHDLISEWDFSMTSTKRLIIEVTVPSGGGGEDDYADSGCVSLLIGLRPSIKKGFN